MIYSKDHKFLFLKNIKVGGTSVEVALSQVLPDNAIVTPIEPKNPNHKPRNYQGFKSHASYKEISKLIDLSDVKTYTIIRNPYDAVLSNFFWALHLIEVDWNNLNKKEKQKYVDNYFDYKNDLNLFTTRFLPSSKFLYTFNKKIIIDKFIRYEDGLEDQINPILKSHNIPEICINVFEKKHGIKNIDPSDIFNNDQMNFIFQEWKWEFDNLGYNK